MIFEILITRIKISSSLAKNGVGNVPTTFAHLRGSHGPSWRSGIAEGQSLFLSHVDNYDCFSTG